MTKGELIKSLESLPVPDDEQVIAIHDGLPRLFIIKDVRTNGKGTRIAIDLEPLRE